MVPEAGWYTLRLFSEFDPQITLVEVELVASEGSSEDQRVILPARVISCTLEADGQLLFLDSSSISVSHPDGYGSVSIGTFEEGLEELVFVWPPAVPRVQVRLTAGSRVGEIELSGSASSCRIAATNGEPPEDQGL